MGTGFNTEVSFNGVRFHVQTEDKGSPRYEIVSHIYQGGAILLTKRLSYGDRPADAQRDLWTQEMTAKQHKDILKIIQQGGIDLLRLYLARESQTAAVKPAVPGSAPLPTVTPEEPALPPMTPPPGVKIPGALRIPSLPPDNHTARGADGPPSESRALERPPAAASPGEEPLRSREFSGPILPVPETLGLRLLNPPDFRGGRPIVLKVMVTLHPANAPLPNVKVIVQIFGLSFRPILFSGRTDASGLFTLDVTLPTFTTGQASLNILAVSEKFGMAELKYAIKRA